MGKSTGCSSKGCEFDSQNTWGDSQSSVTPVTGDQMPPSGSHRHQAQEQAKHSYTYNNKISLKEKKRKETEHEPEEQASKQSSP